MKTKNEIIEKLQEAYDGFYIPGEAGTRAIYIHEALNWVLTDSETLEINERA